jgi:hypothetical protein
MKEVFVICHPHSQGKHYVYEHDSSFLLLNDIKRAKYYDSYERAQDAASSLSVDSNGFFTIEKHNTHGNFRNV